MIVPIQFDFVLDESSMNLYEILRVSPKCSSDELRRQYHRLLLEYHPDKTKSADENNRNQFDEIQSAYRILSDVKLRLKYDQEQQRKELHRLAHTNIDWNQSDEEYVCRCGTILEIDDQLPSNIVECPNCSTRIEISNK